MNFIFREASISDIDNLKQLVLDSYGQFENILSRDNWEKMYSFLNSEQSYLELLSKSTCFICEFEAKIVGMAYLISKGNPTEIFDKDWTYIRMVGVHPNFTGNGIGKKLTKMCIDFAKHQNETVIALHTSEFMDSARHIYENLGFQIAKELNLNYGKKYWLYILYL